MSEVFTSKEFWRRHAPDFNFELNEKQLIEEALKRGFITAPLTNDKCQMYKYNPNYKSVTEEE